MSNLVILGIILAVAVVVLVAGSAGEALGGTFRRANAAKEAKRKRDSERPPTPTRRPERPRWQKYTPERTRLKPWSPEIIAVLLLALAAGLWLARLTR
jgi:hypothetical protein